MGKKAVIIVELVDESMETSNLTISKEMFEWFREEAVPAPWIKEVKAITVQECLEAE